MRRFQFRLENVLEWRVVQLEIEEAKLEGLFAGRNRIDAALRALESEQAESERSVLGAATLEAHELAALGRHREHIAREKERLWRERAGCEQRIAAQRQRVLKAERDLRLLEKLKARRLAEWRAAADREQEALTSEVFLSQWHRRR